MIARRPRLRLALVKLTLLRDSFCIYHLPIPPSFLSLSLFLSFASSPFLSLFLFSLAFNPWVIEMLSRYKAGGSARVASTRTFSSFKCPHSLLEIYTRGNVYIYICMYIVYTYRYVNTRRRGPPSLFFASPS